MRFYLFLIYNAALNFLMLRWYSILYFDIAAAMGCEKVWDIDAPELSAEAKEAHDRAQLEVMAIGLALNVLIIWIIYIFNKQFLKQYAEYGDNVRAARGMTLMYVFIALLCLWPYLILG